MKQMMCVCALFYFEFAIFFLKLKKWPVVNHMNASLQKRSQEHVHFKRHSLGRTQISFSLSDRRGECSGQIVGELVHGGTLKRFETNHSPFATRCQFEPFHPRTASKRPPHMRYIYEKSTAGGLRTYKQ